MTTNPQSDTPSEALARQFAERGRAAIAEVQAIAERALALLVSDAMKPPEEASIQPSILEAIATGDTAQIIAVVDAAFAKAAREASGPKVMDAGDRITDQTNIRELIDADLEDEAVALLMQGVRLAGAVGPRSTRAALAVATRLYAGDLMATIYFMNRRHPWLGGQTPIARAEQSEQDLKFVLDMIGALEAGVYI